MTVAVVDFGSVIARVRRVPVATNTSSSPLSTTIFGTGLEASVDVDDAEWEQAFAMKRDALMKRREEMLAAIQRGEHDDMRLEDLR